MTNITKYIRDLTLTKKIRLSYIIIQVPLMVLLFVEIFNMWNMNNKYTSMIESAVIASEFSLDFKKDFDDETYLLIAGNTTVDDSKMGKLIDDANDIVSELSNVTTSQVNPKRLKSARKYIKNLETYKNRIEENITLGDKYEENINIWENDIQIVSSLLQETMSEYIYYEIRDLQQTRKEYQILYVRMINTIIIASVVFVILMIVMSIYIPKSISRPIGEVVEVTKAVANGDLTARSNVETGAEVKVLNDSLNIMIDKINELLEQVTEEQIRLRKAELELLQAQINPHFLYNTLDTIVWLAEASDKDKVVSMVKSLSDFFRTSLNQGKEIVTIEEEIVHARSYLEIQQVRYQDILEYEIDIPEEIQLCKLPKITIQPLIENALYHGIKNKRGMGKIIVKGQVINNGCQIQVIDNGKGMPEQRLAQINAKIKDNTQNSGEIFGLSNVNERIQLKFGKEYGIRVDSIFEEGTTVYVNLPME